MRRSDVSVTIAGAQPRQRTPRKQHMGRRHVEQVAKRRDRRHLPSENCLLGEAAGLLVGQARDPDLATLRLQARHEALGRLREHDL